MEVDPKEPVSMTMPDHVQEMVASEKERVKQNMPKVELQSLNTRAYLDHTVVPILLDAMTAVAKERQVFTPVTVPSLSLNPSIYIFLLDLQIRLNL